MTAAVEIGRGRISCETGYNPDGVKETHQLECRAINTETRLQTTTTTEHKDFITYWSWTDTGGLPPKVIKLREKLYVTHVCSFHSRVMIPSEIPDAGNGSIRSDEGRGNSADCDIPTLQMLRYI